MWPGLASAVCHPEPIMFFANDHQVPPEPIPGNDPLPDDETAPGDEPVPDHNPVTAPNS